MEKQRWEESEQRREEERESLRRKKIQVREKVGKSRNVFFQWFVAPEGRKVGSLKRRVRSQLARWEMKNCRLLWREAHLQVKKLKTPHVQSTFGSCDVEKVHAAVARSTFRSEHVQNASCSDHFWKLRCRKSARRCGAKHISTSKGEKWGVRSTFGRSDVVLRGRCKGLCTLSKVSKTWGFCGISKKNDCRRGTFEEDLQRWVFRGRRSTRDMFIRDVRRWGRWFPERSCILEHLQFWEDDFAWLVQHFVWPGITFSWQAQYFRQVEWKKCKTQWHEAASSALNFPVLKEASQNCFVLDGVKFQNCEEVSQNCFVLVDR